MKIPQEIMDAVDQAIGAASLCWEPRWSTQKFDTTRAKKIADELCEKIMKLTERVKVVDEGGVECVITRTEFNELIRQEKASPVTKLPDGSAFFTASFPLPKDHWLYREESDPERPPLGSIYGSDRIRADVKCACRQAIRGATNFGRIQDFDPDALLLNLESELFEARAPLATPAPTPPPTPQHPPCQCSKAQPRPGRFPTVGQSEEEPDLAEGSLDSRVGSLEREASKTDDRLSLLEEGLEELEHQAAREFARIDDRIAALERRLEVVDLPGMVNRLASLEQWRSAGDKVEFDLTEMQGRIVALEGWIGRLHENEKAVIDLQSQVTAIEKCERLNLVGLLVRVQKLELAVLPPEDLRQTVAQYNALTPEQVRSLMAHLEKGEFQESPPDCQGHQTPAGHPMDSEYQPPRPESDYAGEKPGLQPQPPSTCPESAQEIGRQLPGLQAKLQAILDDPKQTPENKERAKRMLGRCFPPSTKHIPGSLEDWLKLPATQQMISELSYYREAERILDRFPESKPMPTTVPEPPASPS